MAHQHPSPDQLDGYLTNCLSEVETANVEKHVFTCDVCFPRIASRELYDLAVDKACTMLGQLQTDGIRMLTVSTPAPDAPVLDPVIIPPAPVRIPAFRLWEQPFAAVAASVVAGVLTLSSIDNIHNNFQVPSLSSALKSAPRPQAAPSLPVVSTIPETTPVVGRKKMREPAPAPVVIRARYTRPFLPPNGDVDAPELDMIDAPPPVVAARLQTVSLLADLPGAPKKQVRGSKRVFRAIATPFKKLGGALATLAIGEEIADRRTAD